MDVGVVHRGRGHAAFEPRDLNVRHAFGARRNPGIAAAKAGDTEGLPDRAVLDVMHEPLPLPFARRVTRAVRQRQHMVDGGDMFGGHPDLDHLDIGRCVADAVAYLGRLDHAIACGQAHHAALILIKHIDPAAIAVDQLKPDGVVMHHVGHRPAIGNADVTGDDRAAQTAGDQVTIVHPGPPDHPRGAVTQPADAEFMHGFRLHQLRREGRDLNHRAIGRGQGGLAAGKPRRVVGQDADTAGGHRRPLLDPHPQAVTGQRGDRGVVGGKDVFQPHPQNLGEKRQVVAQFLRRQQDFGEDGVRDRFGHG